METKTYKATLTMGSDKNSIQDSNLDSEDIKAKFFDGVSKVTIKENFKLGDHVRIIEWRN